MENGNSQFINQIRVCENHRNLLIDTSFCLHPTIIAIGNLVFA